MATTVVELAATFIADTTGLDLGFARMKKSFDDFQSTLAKSSSMLDGWAGGLINSITSITPAMAAMSIGAAAAIGAIGKAAFDAAVEFDEASDKIRVATGAVGDDLTRLEGSFKTVFTSIPTSSAAAAEAIGFLAARLHISGEALEELSKTELELARITGEALKPQLEATTRLFSDWDIATQNQSKSLDFLFKVSQQTAVGVTQLSTELVKFGAPLREIGFSFEQAATLIGKFQAEGVELNKALPGLRIALIKMADEGAKNAGEAFQILMEKIKNIEDPLQRVKAAAEIFGKKAGPDMAEAIKQGRFSIAEMQKVIESSTETIQGAAKATDDFGEKWTVLKNKVTTALEPLGKTVMDALTAVVSSFVDTGDEIRDRWNQLFIDLSKAGVLDDFDKAVIKFFIDLADKIGLTGGKSGDAWAAGISEHGQNLKELEKGVLFSLDHMQIIFAEQGKAAGDAYAQQVSKSVLGVMDPLAQSLRRLQQAAALQEARAGGSPGALGVGTVGISDAVIQSWKNLAGSVQQYGFAVGEATKKTKDHKTTVEGATGAHGKFGGALRSSTNELDSFQKRVVEAMKGISDAIDQGLLGKGSGDKIGRAIHDKLSAVLKALADGSKEAEAQTKIFANAVDEVLGSALDDVVPAIQLYDQSLEEHIQWIKEAKEAQERMAQSMKDSADEFHAFSDEFKDLSSQLPHSWNTIIDAILTGSGRLGTDLLKLGVKVKGFAADLLGVFDNLPGKWGDALRKGVSEFERWFNTIDGIVKLIQRVLGSDSPTGLGGILSNLGKIFKGFGTSITEGTKDLAAILGESVESVIAGVGEHAAKIGTTIGGGITSGVSSFLNSSAGLMAAITGAIGLAISTFQSESKTKRFLGGFALGGPIGGILSLIFGGPSERQKAEEAAAIQEAKDRIKLSAESVLQAVQDTIQSTIESFKRALEFFNQLDDFTQVRKAKFQAFFANFNRLMNQFFELASKWSIDNLAKAKQFAESVGPIVDAVGGGITALDGLTRFTPVADSIIQRFADNLGSIVKRMGELFEAIPKELIKHARKLAENLEAVSGVIGPLIEGMGKLFELKPLDDSTLDVFITSLRRIIERMGELADEMDQGMVKAAARFAERAGTVVSVIQGGVEGLSALKDLADVPAESFEAFKRGLISAINTMQDVAQAIDVEMLGRSQAISEKVQTILNTIKTAVDAFAGLKDFAGGLTFNFAGFKEALRGAIQAVIEISQEMNGKAVDAAAIFADSAGKVVTFFGNAASSVKSLDGIFQVQFDFAFVKGAIQGMIEMVTQLANEMSADGVAQASKFATAAGSIVTFMQNVANAFKALKDSTAITTQNVIDLVNGFKLFVQQLLFMSRDLGPDAIANAVTIASQLDIVLATVGRIAATMNAIATVQFPTSDIWQNMLDSIRAMIAAMQQAAAMLGGSELATATAGAASAPTSATSSGIASRSMATTVVNVNVSGNLIHQNRLEDAVVQAVVSAQRRGRL